MKQFVASIILAITLLCAPAQAASLTHKWDYPTGKDLPMSAVMDGEKSYLYAAVKSGGLLVLDVSGNRPVNVAGVDKKQLGGMDAMAVARQGNRLYLALGDFFNAKGDRAGLGIIDIAKPKTPRVLSVWASDAKRQGAAAVAVDGNYAYLGAMSAGVLAFDVSDPANPRLVSTVLPDPDFPRKNPSHTGRPNARGFALHRDTLYVANDAGGIRVLDISDRGHPRETGRYINPAIGSKKQQAYNNLAIDWPFAYAAVDYCGMEVIDLRDPRGLKQLGWWNPWHCEKASNLWFNSPGHTNQIAYDPASHLVYLSAGAQELEVTDVANPAHPALAAHYGDARKKQGAWGLTFAPGSLYLHYITAFIPFRGTWAGIRALAR